MKKWGFIITLSFITAWILYIYTFAYDSTFKMGIENAIFYKGNPSKPQISLTFEVEDGNNILPDILKILEQEHIQHVTFFVNGIWAKKHPDLVKQIITDGHEIGSSGYTTDSYKGKTIEEITQDLLKCKQLFQQLGIHSTQLLRPPTGYYDKTVLQAATKNGFTIVHWSIQSMDQQNINAATITQNVLSTIENGDIVVFHANDYSLQTKRALPLILHQLKEKGYTNISVSDMISNSIARSKVVN